MRTKSRFAKNISASLLVAFVLSGALSVLAQSGRRPKTPASVPAATPEAVPTVNRSTENEEKSITLIVGIDRFGDVPDIPLATYGSVISGCVERLDDAKSVKVKPTVESMSRADAIVRAKDEKEAYVVSLQLRSTSTPVRKTLTRDLNDVYVEFSVFAPTSGKVVASGKTYQRAASLGGIVVKQPTGRNTIADHDRWLKLAAREAAERILTSFRVHVPNGPVALKH